MIWLSAGGWWSASRFGTPNSKPIDIDPRISPLRLHLPPRPFHSPERRIAQGAGCVRVFETALFSTPSPSFSARRAVQAASATVRPNGGVSCCIQDISVLNAPHPHAVQGWIQRNRQQLHRVRDGHLQKLHGLRWVLLHPVSCCLHVLIHPDASNAFGHKYIKHPTSAAPHPQNTAQRRVPETQNPNHETPQP